MCVCARATLSSNDDASMYVVACGLGLDRGRTVGARLGSYSGRWDKHKEHTIAVGRGERYCETLGDPGP